MQISNHFAITTNTQAHLSKQKSDDFVNAYASMNFSEPVEGQYLAELTSFTNELYKSLQAQGEFEKLANTLDFVSTARVLFQDRYHIDDVKPSDLPAMLAILKEPYTLQAGTYMGKPEAQTHFNARKQQAIESLSEFLVQKGLLTSKDEPVSATQKISTDMYFELKFKPKEKEFDELIKALHNERGDLKKDYQSAVNDTRVKSPLQELLQIKSGDKTQNSSNLNELNLASESFFEDLANIYYTETNELVEAMEFMLVEKFLALATRGMNALSTDDIAKGFEYGSKQWQEIPKNEATNKTLLKEMLEISQNEPLIYSNNLRLDEYREREQAFAKDILALFDKQI